MKMLKATLLSSLLVSGFYAEAATISINMNAKVDPKVGIVNANDFSALKDVKLQYDLSKGLIPSIQKVKLLTNDPTKNLSVKLAEAVELKNPLLPADSTSIIPLTIKLGGTELTTTDTSFSVASIFPTKVVHTPAQGSTPASDDTVPDVAQGSNTLDMVISAKTQPTASTVAGHYTATVNLVINQTT